MSLRPKNINKYPRLIPGIYNIKFRKSIPIPPLYFCRFLHCTFFHLGNTFSRHLICCDSKFPGWAAFGQFDCSFEFQLLNTRERKRGGVEYRVLRQGTLSSVDIWGLFCRPCPRVHIHIYNSCHRCGRNIFKQIVFVLVLLGYRYEGSTCRPNHTRKN